MLNERPLVVDHEDIDPFEVESLARPSGTWEDACRIGSCEASTDRDVLTVRHQIDDLDPEVSARVEQRAEPLDAASLQP